MKNSIALTREETVFLSQYIGDLDNPKAYRFFEDSIESTMVLKPFITSGGGFRFPFFQDIKSALHIRAVFIKFHSEIHIFHSLTDVDWYNEWYYVANKLTSNNSHRIRTHANNNLRCNWSGAAFVGQAWQTRSSEHVR